MLDFSTLTITSIQRPYEKGKIDFYRQKTEARKENDLPNGTELKRGLSQENERARPRGKLQETSLSHFIFLSFYF